MAGLQGTNQHDAGGMICGYDLPPDRAPVRLASPPDRLHPPAGCPSIGRPVWVHLNLGDMRSRNWIKACPGLPEHARQTLLSNDPHLRLSLAGDGLTGVIGDLPYEFDEDPEKLGVLALYVDRQWLITARHHPLKATDRLRHEMERASEPIGSPFELLLRLLNDMGEQFDAAAGKLSDAVDSAEDGILKDRVAGDDLALVRRVVARLRRHVSADRQALSRLASRLPAWCGEELAAQFRAAAERIEAVGHDLELVQDRARLLQEEIARRMNEATGRNLYLLSILTAVFLPVTLITGIFGMNVGGLPWLEDAGGFWWVAVVMAMTLIGSLVLLRWKKLL